MVKNEYNFQLVRGIVFLSFFSYLCERLLVKDGFSRSYNIKYQQINFLKSIFENTAFPEFQAKDRGMKVGIRMFMNGL